MKGKESISQRFGKLGNRQRVLLALLIGSFIVRFYFLNVYKPTFVKLRRLRPEITSLNNKITRIKSTIPDIKEEERKLNEVRNRYANLKNRLSSLEDSLPVQARIPQLLGRLIEESAGLNIDFISIKPKQEKQKEYASLDIQLKFDSDYSSLVNYLNRLENLSQFLKVIHVSMGGMEKEQSKNIATVILTTLLGEPSESAKGIYEVEIPVIDSRGRVSIKRDPFASHIKPMATKEGGKREAEYILSGITIRGGNSTAIINNNVYRVGDVVVDKTLKQILPNMVVLSDGKKEVVILMGK